MPAERIYDLDLVTVPLKVYLERIIEERYQASNRALLEAVATVKQLDDAHWDAHSREHVLQALALQKQEDVQAVRNTAQNEWRATLTDQQARFATKEWADGQLASSIALRDAMNARIDALERENIRVAAANASKRDEDAKALAKLESQQRFVGLVFSGVAIAMTIIGFAAAKLIH